MGGRGGSQAPAAAKGLPRASWSYGGLGRRALHMPTCWLHLQKPAPHLRPEQPHTSAIHMCI